MTGEGGEGGEVSIAIARDSERLEAAGSETKRRHGFTF